MVGDVDTPPNDLKSSNEEDLKQLEDDFRKLQEQTQDLINERAHLESEIRSMKNEQIGLMKKLEVLNLRR